MNFSQNDVEPPATAPGYNTDYYDYGEGQGPSGSTASGSSSSSSSGASVTSSTVESAKYIDWTNIVHFILWVIGGFILIVLLWKLISAVSFKKQQTAPSSSSSSSPRRPQRQPTDSAAGATDDNKTEPNNSDDGVTAEDVENPPTTAASSSSEDDDVNDTTNSRCRRHKTYALLLFCTVIGFSLSVLVQASCDFLRVGYVDEDGGSSSFTNNFDRIGLWKASPAVGPYEATQVCYSTFRGNWEDDDDSTLDLYNVIFHESWGTPDTALKVSRVMAILSSLIGGILLLWFWLCMCWQDGTQYVYHKCCCGGQYHRAVIVIALAVVAIFQMATLCLKSTAECSDLVYQKCYFDDGAISAFTASVYWALASFAAGLLPL